MLPKNFKPYKVKLRNLIRLGSKFDGGYVIDNRVISKTKYLITCGLNDDWSFEKEFLKKNPNCYLLAYDHSVTRNYWKNRFKQDFIKFISFKKLSLKKILDIFKYIDYVFFFRNRNKHFIKKIVKKIKKASKKETVKNILKDKNNIILKIDIENDEYKILPDIITNSIKINLLIIEFHNVHKNLDRIIKFINNFKLKLIHIHGNNYMGINKNNDPNVLEMTFLNHKKYKIEDHKTNFKYPIPNLDYPNLKRNPDITLRFND